MTHPSFAVENADYLHLGTARVSLSHNQMAQTAQMTQMAPIESPKSPCMRICAVSARTGFCIGCGRKLIEIGGWSGFSDDEKRAVLAQLPARLANMQTA